MVLWSVVATCSNQVRTYVPTLYQLPKRKEGILSVYLDWVRSSESECNLYELATKNINIKAFGRKGGKAKPTRKPRNKQAVTCTITNRDQLASAVGQSTVHQPSSHWSLPTSSTFVSSNTFPINSLQASTNAATPPLPLFHSSTQPSNMPIPAPPFQPWQNNNPFVLMNINGRIKKCIGCQN